MTQGLNTPRSLEPLWWMLFYVTAVPAQVCGGKVMWIFIRYTAVSITVILALYCVVTVPEMHFQRYARFTSPSSPWFVGGGKAFMENLFLAAWFFVGVEALPLANEETMEVKSETG
jgi:amino acid permease